MKVTIKNYQAIKEAYLDFSEGITAIVGQTNSGKSSIVRAVESAINNKGGNSFINYEAKETEVEIEDYNHKVTWFKARKSGDSRYVIDDKVLNKIGKGPLDEVSEIFNMSEVSVTGEKIRLNFWKQMTQPFLISKTPFQLFDFISRSKEQEYINSLQDDNKKNLDEVKLSIDKANIIIDTKNLDIKNKTKEVSSLEDFKNFDLETLNFAHQIQDSIKISIEKYKTSSLEVEKFTSTLNKLNKKVETLTHILESLSTHYSKYLKINEALSKYKDAETSLGIKTEQMNNLNEKINRLKTIDGMPTILIDIENKSTTKKEISEAISSYNKCLGSLSKQKEALTYLEERIKNYEKELEGFEFCPMCGQPLKNHKENIDG